MLKKTAKYFVITLIICNFAVRGYENPRLQEAHPLGVTPRSEHSQPTGLGGFDTNTGKEPRHVWRGFKAFSNVTVCVVKLSNFDIRYSGNATENVCVRGLYPFTSCTPIFSWVCSIGVEYIVIMAWADLRCLSLSEGNAKA